MNLAPYIQISPHTEDALYMALDLGMISESTFDQKIKEFGKFVCSLCGEVLSLKDMSKSSIFEDECQLCHEKEIQDGEVLPLDGDGPED